MAKLRQEAQLCRDMASRMSLHHERTRLIEMAERHEAVAAALEPAAEEPAGTTAPKPPKRIS